MFLEKANRLILIEMQSYVIDEIMFSLVIAEGCDFFLDCIFTSRQCGYIVALLAAKVVVGTLLRLANVDVFPATVPSGSRLVSCLWY